MQRGSSCIVVRHPLIWVVLLLFCWAPIKWETPSCFPCLPRTVLVLSCCCCMLILFTRHLRRSKCKVPLERPLPLGRRPAALLLSSSCSSCPAVPAALLTLVKLWGGVTATLTAAFSSSGAPPMLCADTWAIVPTIGVFMYASGATTADCTSGTYHRNCPVGIPPRLTRG